MRRALPLLLLALVACGDKATPRGDATVAPSTTPPAHSYAPDGVVLRVSHSGGFAPPIHAADLPTFTLYGDGRVTTIGPQVAIYPGPAFPNVLVRRVAPETVDWLAAQARAAGIDGEKRDYGTPHIADGANTDFHLSDATGTVDLSVYMLSETDDGLTDRQRADRERLSAFVARLGDPGTWPGSNGDDEPYVPTTVAVYASAYHDDGAKDVTPQVLAWGGPDPADGTDAHFSLCTLLTGDALARALPDLRRSNTLTKWTYGGKAWRFVLRPLLPDETSCP